jgi:hypothetical protein
MAMVSERRQEMRSDVEDDDVMVPDGGSVRVPVMLMDHDPRFSRSTDATAARRAARDARVAWVRSLGDAWRGPAPSRHITQPVTRPTNVRDARALSNAAYREMCAKLQDAWRTPSRDAAEPNNSSPAEVMRRHLSTEPDDNVQARRDAAWAQYRDQLSNAWRQGRTDPNAATAIEQRLERERGNAHSAA